MSNSKFIISLDFELFWGVTDVQDLDSYRQNVLGEWEAIPRMLDQFEKYEISASWAAVGMTICENYDEWLEFVPDKTPNYKNKKLSNYNYGDLAQQNPELFFGKGLLKKIDSCPNQEIATHSFSHMYFNEDGIDKGDMEKDLDLAFKIAKANNLSYSSIVFPRNQYNDEILDLLPGFGIKNYRGNLDHFLYRDGHYLKGGKATRSIRFLDSFFPIHVKKTYSIPEDEELRNIPAGFFLRPYQGNPKVLNPLKLKRLLNQMNKAAQEKEIFHLWWHPHNFGVFVEENLNYLEIILSHFQNLRDKYDMESCSMSSLSS